MCKIRIIIKNSDDTILVDQVHELEVKMSAFDRPSYVEVKKSNGIYVKLNYVGSSEVYAKEEYNNIKITYGQVSGRIRECELQDDLNNTDSYHFYKKITKEDSSERYKNNVKFGLAFVNAILNVYSADNGNVP